MRLGYWIFLFVVLGAWAGLAKAQVMPQQQNCTTTTSGSISHTFCGPPVVVQVAAPPVTVAAPAVTVNVQPPPAPVKQSAPPPKKVND